MLGTISNGYRFEACKRGVEIKDRLNLGLLVHKFLDVVELHFIMFMVNLSVI